MFTYPQSSTNSGHSPSLSVSVACPWPGRAGSVQRRLRRTKAAAERREEYLGAGLVAGGWELSRKSRSIWTPKRNHMKPYEPWPFSSFFDLFSSFFGGSKIHQWTCELLVFGGFMFSRDTWLLWENPTSMGTSVVPPCSTSSKSYRPHVLPWHLFFGCL